MCDGYLNCSEGEERTWTYGGDDDRMGCRGENGSRMILCGDKNLEIVMSMDNAVSGRRKFSFWTVARHRLKKVFGKRLI